jgi:ketosteroid isomerase-like protein
MSQLCRCQDATLLWSGVADDYAEAHLVTHEVLETGDVVYRCPDTRLSWIGEFVADRAGTQTFRLRRILRAAELVEMLAAQTGAAALEWMDPAVEFRPPGSSTTYRGADKAQEWADRSASNPNAPRSTVISVIDVADEQAVALGNVAFRRDGRYIDHRPAAWLVTSRDGRIARSLWFDSWNAARTAAGLPESGGPAGRRIGKRFLFSVRRALHVTGARARAGHAT